MSARTENAARGLAMQGIDPAQGRASTGSKFRDAQRDESVKAAKADILLDEIARRERIEALGRRRSTRRSTRLAERLQQAGGSAAPRRWRKRAISRPLRARIREEQDP